VDVAVHQGGFTDALGAEDDDFGFEGVGHCGGAWSEGVDGVLGCWCVVVVVVVLGAHFSVVGWRGVVQPCEVEVVELLWAVVRCVFSLIFVV
jgi:hypothetical protein